MNKLLVIFLLVSITVFPQPQKHNRQIPQINPVFNSEAIIFPETDSTANLYFTYRIAYEHLVFHRNNDEYFAKFRVILEVKDDNSNIIKRDVQDSKIVVEDFELTRSKKLCLQNVLSFKLPAGLFKIHTTISDLNSNKEMDLPPTDINTVNASDKPFYPPFVINSADISCNENKAFELANYGGNIPFGPGTYNLVIPVRDSSVDELDINVINNEETVLTEKVMEAYTIPVTVLECDGKIVAAKDTTKPGTKNFILRNLSNYLHEGRALIKIHNEENDFEEEINLNVVWIDKPFSLLNPENAIELLTYIETDSVISRMLDEDEDLYPKVLHDYWALFDPDPETTYNPLMAEYYSRIDYAMREFRGLGRNNGARSDRGLIYIRFGKPEIIERSSSVQGYVIETWTYLKPERKFIFEDKNGTGNFTLIEN